MSPGAKAFFASLVVLLLLHTAISFALYHVFTSTTRYPFGTRAEPPPPGLDSPKDSVVFIQERRFTPILVVFYIAFGYFGLFMAALFWAYHLWVRRQ